MTVTTRDQIKARAVTHVARGGKLRPGAVAADYAGQCSSPKGVHNVGRYTSKSGENQYGPANGWPVFEDLLVRCRNCKACGKARRAEWYARSLRECQTANRTWFATLTLTSDEHQRALCEGMKVGTSEWEARCRGIVRLVQRAMKRLRAATGRPVRYMMVIERHKSGLPHVHMLIHEPGKPIRWSELQKQWPHGHSQIKLIDAGAGVAGYTAKYLTKAEGRIRASRGYGTPLQDSESVKP